MFGIRKAKCDRIIYLDTDEILSPKLRKDLRSIVNNASKNYVTIRTAMIHLDSKERLLLGSFWPDWKIRIFLKDKIIYRRIIHEQPIVKGKILDLPEDRYYIIHLAALDSNFKKNRMKKILRYARLEALMKHDLGYTNSIAKTILYISPASVPLIWLYMASRTILKGYPINVPALIEIFYSYALYLGISQMFMNLRSRKKNAASRKVQEIGLIQLLELDRDT
jgi:hypothetical protein